MAPISSVYSEGAIQTVAAQWFVIGFVCCLLPALAASIAAVFFLKRRLKSDAEGGKDANGQAGKGAPTTTKSAGKVQQGRNKKPPGKNGPVVHFSNASEPEGVYENGENPYDVLAGEDNNVGESERYMQLQAKG